MKTNALQLKIFHSVVVAVSASLFCIETLVLSGLSVHVAFFEIPAFLFLIFCATLFSYSVGYIFPHPINSIQVLYQNKFLLAICIADIVAVAIFVARHYHDILNFEFAIVSAVILILSYYYLSEDENKLLKPHSNLLAKNLSLVTVWGLTTVALPMLIVHQNIFSSVNCALLLERMLFVYALVIPFEIRDYEKDKVLNNKNIVHLLGDANSKIIAAILLIAFCMTAYFYSSSYLNFITMICSAVISFVLIVFYNKDSRHHNQYLIFIDGMMMLQALLVIGLNW